MLFFVNVQKKSAVTSQRAIGLLVRPQIRCYHCINYRCRMPPKMASTPGIEPGIFRSVGGRLIHWAMRNEAAGRYFLWDGTFSIFSHIYTYETSMWSPSTVVHALLLRSVATKEHMLLYAGRYNSMWTC